MFKILYFRWMEYNYLFYGYYSNNNAGPYKMAVAYFFVMFCCFSLSFINIVRHSARYFKQGYQFNEFNSSQYFNLVFSYWDFSITSEKSAKIKQVLIFHVSLFDKISFT